MINAPEGDASRDRSRTLTTVQKEPGPKEHRTSRWSVGSTGSLLSIGSSGSILSIASTGSILSIGSAGSFASIASAGSFLSVGSLCSALSVLSAFSYRSHRGNRVIWKLRSAQNAPHRLSVGDDVLEPRT
jgi:hypothetical protein